MHRFCRVSAQSVSSLLAAISLLLARARPSFGLFCNGRLALKFDRQKINIHEAGHEIDPKADKPASGSADLCLLVEDSLDGVVAALHEHHVDHLSPVSRTGAHGAITSVYVRDPVRNLIELSRYDED